MQTNVLEDVKELKAKYEPEGFIILGVFGSYARGDFRDDSDLDILYELDGKFLDAYGGFDACARLADIREELIEFFGRVVDIADRSALDEIGKKYILSEVVYV